MKRFDVYTDGMGYSRSDEVADGDWVKYEDAQQAIQEAVLTEREACAKFAELSHPNDWAFIGAALRARKP